MAIYTSKTELTIPFFDNDPMGVVWHGNYVKYIEIARCEMLNKLDYNYIDMKNDGVAYPIAKLEMKYIKPISFNQKIVIKSEIEEIEPSLIIKYTFFDEKNNKLFKAKTMQICVNIDTHESVYTAPKRFKELLNV